MRCELRGLFPGGHTVELRLPAAVLKRSVVIGHPWPARPALVRARDAADVGYAADAGADGVIADADDPVEVIEAAHARSLRALTTDAQWIELGSADGLLGASVPPELLARFPEARSLSVDAAASAAVAAFAGGAGSDKLGELGRARGLVEAPGLLGAALALIAPAGALVDGNAFPLLKARRKHPALRAGSARVLAADGSHYGVALSAKSDDVAMWLNADAAPWRAPAAPEAVDLLGGKLDGNEATVGAHGVVVLVAAPRRDPTRY
jgi:hypothetical protein